VRRPRIEVVLWAVQVHRHRKDRIEIVLLAVRLGLDQQHLLRQPIRRVRLLRVAFPDVFLAEWHRRVLRVGADGPDGDQCLTPSDPPPTRGLVCDYSRPRLVQEPRPGPTVGRPLPPLASSPSRGAWAWLATSAAAPASGRERAA